MPDSHLTPVVAILDLVGLIVLLLLAICVIRIGVFWGMKDFEKWKDGRATNESNRARKTADREDAKLIAAKLQEEARRPAGPREEAQYRR